MEAAEFWLRRNLVHSYHFADSCVEERSSLKDLTCDTLYKTAVEWRLF
jgi:hypothetical protein